MKAQAKVLLDRHRPDLLGEPGSTTVAMESADAGVSGGTVDDRGV